MISYRAPSAITFLYIKLTLVALCWAGTFIAGRSLATEIPAITAAAGRFAIASLLLLLLLRFQEGSIRWPTAKQLFTTAMLGLTGVFIYNLAFLSALAVMPASRTAIFVAFNPLITALLTLLLLREKPPTSRWVGIGVALMGALTVISRGDLYSLITDISRVFGAGEITMLTAVLCWALYTLLGKRALSGMTPLAATFWASAWGLLMLLMVQLYNWPQLVDLEVSLSAIVNLLYLSVLGTVVPFVWFYQGVRELGPSRTAVFTNLVPVFAVILAALILGEALSMALILGGVLVVIGLMLTNRS